MAWTWDAQLEEDPKKAALDRARIQGCAGCEYLLYHPVVFLWGHLSKRIRRRLQADNNSNNLPSDEAVVLLR